MAAIGKNQGLTGQGVTLSGGVCRPSGRGKESTAFSISTNSSGGM
jgi:hypothetical protein